MIRVRVDDFPETRGEPQHTLTAFREFHRRLTEGIGGRRYLLGVIPGRCRPEHLLMLRNETDCVIGMHGTDHDEARLDRNGGNQFEPYLTEADVTRALMENKAALESAVGRRSCVYMPPRNVIDRRTHRAIFAAGFEWFTTGPETERTIRELPNAIHSEPPHCYGRTDEMWARHSQSVLPQLEMDGEDAVLCLHHTWETNIGLEHMTRFFAALPKDIFGDFDG